MRETIGADEWTAEEEREAFLCTSRLNMVRWLVKKKSDF